MKLLRFLVVTLAVLLVGGLVPLYAQGAAIDNTTLSAAVQPGDTTITLGAVTCTGCTFGPGTTIYVDLEQMLVAPSYTSGTTVQVIRQGRRTGHKSGAVVYYGPANRFYNSDPPPGLCNKFGTVPPVPWYPWLNLSTGAEWLCDNGANQYATATWRVIYPYAIGTLAASR